MYVGDAAATKLNATLVRTASKANEMTPVFEAELYPNPAKDRAVLRMKSPVENATVSIVDVTGKSIWQKVFRSATAIQLPVEKLVAGVYVVTVTSEKGSKTYRLVKE